MTTDNKTENGITAEIYNKLFVGRLTTDEGVEKVNEVAHAFFEERINEKKFPCRVEDVSIKKIDDGVALKFSLRGPSKKVEHTRTWTDAEILAFEKPITLSIEAELEIAVAELAKL